MLTICITGHHVICLTAQVKQDMKDFNTLVTAENKKFECPQTKIGTGYGELNIKNKHINMSHKIKTN